MYALTLHQPWASLVACGAKQWETRSWSTHYCGPLLITAARAFPRDYQQLAMSSPFVQALDAAGYTPYEIPTGKALCVVDLVDVRLTEQADVRAQERAFGDYTPGRFAWQLTNRRELRPWIPSSGRQRLWKPAPALCRQIQEQLGGVA